MFELGTILFPALTILICVLVIIALAVFIQRGRQRSHQLDRISRKLGTLIEQHRHADN